MTGQPMQRPARRDPETTYLGRLEQVLHETTESRQVGRDRWDSHHGTFSRSVTPRLVCGLSGIID